MDHLPYIVAAYGLTFAVAIGFSVDAWLRVGRARRKLDEIDPRGRR